MSVTKMTSLVTLCAFALVTICGFNGGIAESVDDAPYGAKSHNGVSAIDGQSDVFDGQRYFENEKSFTEGSRSAGHWEFRAVDRFGENKKQKLEWWQTSVLYEVYIRSFKDSDGNGVGDLRGIIEKVPYLKDLGIGAIWITPLYKSPGFDLGYDITDFKDIDELFGSMADFEELKTKLHANGIRVVLDFVPNHTSEEHEWFLKSVQKIEPYTDYYVWANATFDVNGTRQPPNNWNSVFEGSMWEWNEQREQYYLHQFYKQQPDLNYRNPLVKEEIKNVLRFWMDKGVDGFRFDAVSSLYEREDLTDAPVDRNNVAQRPDYTDGLPECFDEVKAWRAVLDESKKNNGEQKLMVVESYLAYENETKFYGDETHPGAHFPLSIVLAYWPYTVERTANYYVDTLTKHLSMLPTFAWPSWSIGNHDMNRAAYRFGEELTDGIRMMQLLLPGTPVIYQTDELGLSDADLREDQLIDIKSKQKGASTPIFRERSRTPFQWDATPQAGFSTKKKPYLPVNPNYVTYNVEYQNNVTRSHLKVSKDLIKLRRLDVFRSGDLEIFEVSKYVLAISRSDKFYKTFFVVVNLGSELEEVNLKQLKAKIYPKMKVKVASVNAEQTVGNTVHSKSFTLRPKAALVLESSYFKFHTE